MQSIKNIDLESLENDDAKEFQDDSIQSLESGNVVIFPNLSFELTDPEKVFLTPSILKPKSKNISYDKKSDRLSGSKLSGTEAEQLKQMVKRFAETTEKLIQNVFPGYVDKIEMGRTSYRPVEAEGRRISNKKDDTLLHVDAFPSSPVKGKRILRIFANINPNHMPRVWKVGEPFEAVVKGMAPRVKKPFTPLFPLMNLVGITKTQRTIYDHYMLKIHDAMKDDPKYQANVPQQVVQFPAGCTWMVFTDQVSHAVLSGQFVLEQTFYLPVEGMRSQQLSPLRVLEKFLNKKLL